MQLLLFVFGIVVGQAARALFGNTYFGWLLCVAVINVLGIRRINVPEFA